MAAVIRGLYMVVRPTQKIAHVKQHKDFSQWGRHYRFDIDLQTVALHTNPYMY